MVETKSSDGATTSDKCNFHLSPGILHLVWKGHNEHTNGRGPGEGGGGGGFPKKEKKRGEPGGGGEDFTENRKACRGPSSVTHTTLTSCILVLKFANKGVFLRKSRICIFLEKWSILVLTFVNLEKKGLVLMFGVLLWKWGYIWAEKSV